MTLHDMPLPPVVLTALHFSLLHWFYYWGAALLDRNSAALVWPTALGLQCNPGLQSFKQWPLQASMPGLVCYKPVLGWLSLTTEEESTSLSCTLLDSKSRTYSFL